MRFIVGYGAPRWWRDLQARASFVDPVKRAKQTRDSKRQHSLVEAQKSRSTGLGLAPQKRPKLTRVLALLTVGCAAVVERVFSSFTDDPPSMPPSKKEQRRLPGTRATGFQVSTIIVGTLEPGAWTTRPPLSPCREKLDGSLLRLVEGMVHNLLTVCNFCQ